MILDSKRGANAILIDLDESGFTLFVIHVSHDVKEINCRGFNGEGSINDNLLAKAAILVESTGMAAKLLLVQVRKPNNCGFGAGFEAM